MRFCFALASLALTWQYFGPTAAISLQTFAPCEDLSPHCPALCASCETADTWPNLDKSFEFFAPEATGHRPPQKPNATNGKQQADRQKRFAVEGHGPSATQESKSWLQVPSERPDWLPTWIPWWYKPRPRPGQHGSGGTGGPIVGGGPQGGPGGPSGHGDHGPPPYPPHGGPGGNVHIPELPSKDCSDLVNGGRQLIEAFCPRSCGRCGRSSSPLVAAKNFVGAQCTVAKDPPVAFALQ